MILETPRLHLRPVTVDDVPAIQRYFSPIDIIKYIGGQVPWPYPEDGALTHFKEEIEAKHGKRKWFWAITEKERPGQLIGMIELRHKNDKQDDHLGYWLAIPFHGKGYMSEAVQAVIDYGFTEQDFSEITASSHLDNIGSRRVQEKCGLRFLRTEHCKPYHDGTREHNVLGITREEWLRLKTFPLSPKTGPQRP